MQCIFDTIFSKSVLNCDFNFLRYIEEYLYFTLMTQKLAIVLL